MKIAIHNSYFGKSYAETELARRIVLAAHQIGWQAAEFGYSEDISQYQPDFVLVLHFKAPKLTAFPTYGCLWNPIAFIETNPEFTRNILSYDAYLSSCATTDQWLSDRLYNTPKKYFIAPFFTSCNRTEYQEPDLDVPRLAYVGTNWDGARFKDLFLGLEHQGCSEIYGNPAGWNYLNSSYRGSLAFDGTSVLKVLNQAGVGLCLHRDEHTREGIPSMRIFEIAASGAIALCGDHPFIRDQFKDTVLYLDPHLRTTDQIIQITDHLNWIKTHPEAALEMSRAAHHIFVEKFSLESLLSNLQPHHQRLIPAKGFIHHDEFMTASDEANSSVQLLVRMGDRGFPELQQTLHSIQQQTYRNLSVLLLRNKEINGLENVLDHCKEKIAVQVLDCKLEYNSSDLWQGLQSLSAAYFGVLESGTVLAPNHVHTLVQLFNQFPDVGMAYSEVIQLWQERPNSPALQPCEEVIDWATLMPVQITELSHLLPFIHRMNLNAFLARSPLVDEFLQQDPHLPILEDVFLLLNLAGRGKALCSYEATCQINQKLPALLNHGLEKESVWRIQAMVRDREFPTGTAFRFEENSRLQQAEAQLQQTTLLLQQAQQRIAAMETSKFWQFRQRWFQLKRRLGLNTDNE